MARGAFLVALVVLAASPPAAADSMTFSYSGAAQTWTVPAGVTQATFDLYGAQGANSCPGDVEGAHVRGTIAVIPGATLQVLVGGHAGFNGGGGIAGHVGGGASDVRRGPGFALADRLLVAGGGGGDSARAPCNFAFGRGGASGSGGQRGQDDSNAYGGDGGHPGTASAGGAGGGGGPGLSNSGTKGADGSLGQGGDGGNGPTGPGGGGGGGYYGGGGGGGGGNDNTHIGQGNYYEGSPGGGGGGSSYTGDATGAAVTEGVRDGDGMALVTYTPAPDTGGGGGSPPPGGNAGGGDTTPPGGNAGGADTTPPSFIAASVTNPVFAVDRNGAAEPIASARARKPKKGTTLVYTLSEPARVLFVVDRARPGRIVGAKCRKPSSKNRHGKPCTRFVSLGAFAQDGVAGVNRKKWSGKLGDRALKPGRYRVSLKAKDTAGNTSKVTRLKVRIVSG